MVEKRQKRLVPQKPILSERRISMIDVLFVVITLVVFIIFVAYTFACDRL
jgi:hypothetical protein